MLVLLLKSPVFRLCLGVGHGQCFEFYEELPQKTQGGKIKKNAGIGVNGHQIRLPAGREKRKFRARKNVNRG